MGVLGQFLTLWRCFSPPLSPMQPQDAAQKQHLEVQQMLIFVVVGTFSFNHHQQRYHPNISQQHQAASRAGVRAAAQAAFKVNPKSLYKKSKFVYNSTIYVYNCTIYVHNCNAYMHMGEQVHCTFPISMVIRSWREVEVPSTLSLKQ